MRTSSFILLGLVSMLVSCKENEKPKGASSSAASIASAKAPEPPPEKPHERTVLATFKKPKGLAVEGGQAFIMDAISGDKTQNELLDVFRVALGGEKGEPGRLATKQRAAGTPVVLKDELVYAVAADPPGTDRIVRLPRAGGAPQTIAPKAISAADPAVAVGGTNLFYLAPGANDKTFDVMRVPVQGGKFGTPTKLVTGDRTARLLFIVADSKYVYFPEAGRIVKVPVAGGERAEVGKVVYAWAAASDGKHLYWADSPGDNMGTIRRAPVEGGATDTLASGFSYPVGIALDDKSVYFVNYDAEDGGVFRVAKTGGTTVALLHGQKHPKRIALDEKYVYFVNVGEGTLVRIEK